MNLIDGPSESDSLFARAFALREQRPGASIAEPTAEEDQQRAKSNWDRIRSRTETAPATHEPRVDPGAAVRALVKELQTQRHHGIVTPSQLFSMLHRHLELERGALLVPETEGDHLPLATAGLDRASTLRLRLSDDEVEQLMPDGRPAVISGVERTIFADRLSKADYRSSPKIVLFPFRHVRRTMATLAVFASPVLQFGNDVLDAIHGALIDGAAQLIFDGRFRAFGDRSRSVVVRGREVRNAVARVDKIARSTGRSSVGVEIDLQSLLDDVTSIHPLLDRERLTIDVVDTVGLLLAADYQVLGLPGNRLAFVGVSRPNWDPELTVHLLGTSLSQLFGLGRRAHIAHVELSASDIQRLREG